MPEITPSRYVVSAGWDDVPHLTAEAKRELLATTLPHLRKARSQGVPSLGAGAVYPVDFDEIVCAPFAIPPYWPRAYGMDVGWNRTAAVWVARDPTDGVFYVYAEHYRGQAVPLIHAEAIKTRGAWIKGAIDPASAGSSQVDGAQLLDAYRSHGLHLVPAVNAVEAGLTAIWQKLEIGQIRVFSTLRNFRQEYEEYRRDETGKIVKEFDHLMDAWRYVMATWPQVQGVKPMERVADVRPAISDQQAGY